MRQVEEIIYENKSFSLLGLPLFLKAMTTGNKPRASIFLKPSKKGLNERHSRSKGF